MNFKKILKYLGAGLTLTFLCLGFSLYYQLIQFVFSLPAHASNSEDSLVKLNKELEVFESPIMKKVAPAPIKTLMSIEHLSKLAKSQEEPLIIDDKTIQLSKKVDALVSASKLTERLSEYKQMLGNPTEAGTVLGMYLITQSGDPGQSISLHDELRAAILDTPDLFLKELDKSLDHLRGRHTFEYSNLVKLMSEMASENESLRSKIKDRLIAEYDRGGSSEVKKIPLTFLVHGDSSEEWQLEVKNSFELTYPSEDFDAVLNKVTTDDPWANSADIQE